ncbi:thiol-disulfide isomerase/thioredoxin [Pedobacter africanus]|uniref:Thiol-disulfide isomerase/thioredoxin n=1 Tax=Pedobacter africanus TaxID=151894 RepID=A0ACC6KVU9_9SPHI|nr:TlpA disulfide reductase family protein [Pedobacter africanus]MDR6783277.1 thiol-disulfide isomerase/thioredoxin [Pedobacter africanus]
MKNYIKYLFICWMLFNTVVLNAQERKLAIQNVIQWQKNHTLLDGKSELPIKKFGSKLVLLDFFTTWCTSCIASFPFMNDLQVKFKDQVQVLMVTPESRTVVEKFFSKNDYVKGNKLPIVIEDKWFSGSFPHKGVPHVVWIYKDTVIAITGKDMVTSDNIEKVLGKKDITNWPVKNDFAVDSAVVGGSQLEDSYISKFGFYKIGYPLQYRIDTSNQKLTYHMTNVDPIPALLYVIGLEKKLPLMKKERIILNVRNLDRFINVDSIPKSFWLQKNAFCFSSDWPTSMESSKRNSALLTELANRLNIHATYEHQKARVWLIRPDPQLKNKVQSGDIEIGNWKTLLEIANPDFPPLIIEGVPLITRVASQFAVNDLVSLKKAMESNGFSVEEVERKIECLVIFDK